MADCEQKFGWPGLHYLLQTAFMRVDRIGEWPDTTPRLVADDLRKFFRDLTRDLIELDDAESNGDS